MALSEETKAGIITVLTAMAEMYGRKVSEAGFSMWLTILDPYEPKEIRAAFMDHYRESKFFPVPADIIERINGGGKVNEQELHDAAVQAWKKASNSVSMYGGMAFKDPCIGHAIEASGGLRRWGMMTSDDEGFVRRDFIDAYKVFARRHRMDGALENKILGGLHSAPTMEHAIDTGTNAGKLLPGMTMQKALAERTDMLIGEDPGFGDRSDGEPDAETWDQEKEE